jgi:hypothetical protein
MKSLLLIIFLFINQAQAASGVKGKVSSPKECSNKTVMVWLSLDKDNYKERLLLMHTEVPVGGTFQFYLKPGDYQLRASDESGCEFYQKLKVDRTVASINVLLEKK